ncbi:MAG: cytochrome c biogenesis protein CcsA [Desulfovibrionaceae bacterium]|nr:cytochrome c biogenesis protein CcsA [Desulfovibrionaceae bacterium]
MPRISPLALMALLGGLLMAASHPVILLYAPLEEQMGIIQKIFYLHLPLAWWGLFSFFLVFIASLLFLIRRDYFWDTLAEAGAEAGLVLAALTLVTGMIWARVSWNTWWTWDPRLSTTLILSFIYAGYMLTRGLDFSRERRALISAALGIVAFLDVPLVFFSAKLWPQTMHPQVVTGPKAGGLEPEMKLTLFFCLAAFGVFWAALLILRCRLGLAANRLEGLRARLALKENTPKEQDHG